VDSALGSHSPHVQSTYHVPQTSTALSFLFIYWAHNVRQETKEGNVMSDVANCRAMELLCRERATADPSHSGKWLGQAKRWRELEQRETAWQFQRRNRQQQMHAGPMAMGPNPVGRDLRNKQQG
jgi:hypothetical protein